MRGHDGTVGLPVSHCVAETIGSRIEVEYYKIVGQSSILHSSIHYCEHGKKVIDSLAFKIRRHL